MSTRSVARRCDRNLLVFSGSGDSPTRSIIVRTSDVFARIHAEGELNSASMRVPGGGIEPPFQAPKARVLPLDDPGGRVHRTGWSCRDEGTRHGLRDLIGVRHVARE